VRATAYAAAILAVASLLHVTPASGQMLSFLDDPTCPEHGLSVEVVEHGRSRSILARRSGLLEDTVGLSGSMENVETSVPLPLTADVAGEGPTELVRLRPRYSLRPMFFMQRVRWCPGVRGGRHDDGHVYSLPYAPGRCFIVAQGPLGSFSHGPGSGAEQAVDFGMPNGSLVCAAREGVVIHVRQDSAPAAPSSASRAASTTSWSSTPTAPMPAMPTCPRSRPG
jgi:hypothetical protein